MEDLTQALQDILGSKEGQEKLKNVADMLGAGEGKGLDLSSLGSLFGGKKEEPVQEQDSEEDPFGGLDINMLLQVKNMMSTMNRNDKNVDLIRALKPHLRPERQAKADEAMKIMKLISLLPTLKESGLLGKIGL